MPTEIKKTQSSASGHVIKPAWRGRLNAGSPPEDGGEGEPFASSTYLRAIQDSAPSCKPTYLIASALGGEPMPPGIFSGADVRKKS